MSLYFIIDLAIVASMRKIIVIVSHFCLYIAILWPSILGVNVVDQKVNIFNMIIDVVGLLSKKYYDFVFYSAL